jgi:hypothetical protein
MTHTSKHYGEYEYKGFSIWNTGDKEWIAEPDWTIEAIEKYKETCGRHRTIVEAKKWVRKIGVNLNEEDYL